MLGIYSNHFRNSILEWNRDNYGHNSKARHIHLVFDCHYYTLPIISQTSPIGVNTDMSKLEIYSVEILSNKEAWTILVIGNLKIKHKEDSEKAEIFRKIEHSTISKCSSIRKTGC